MDNQLVSIIMPSYNTAHLIKESIDSVLNQTYTNFELIIIDDCSTDNTDEVVAEYKDERIVYLKNEGHSGAAVSRNLGLKEAKGKWVAFLDSDDLWEKDKLSKQIQFMVEQNSTFSFTSYYVLNGNQVRVTEFAPKKDVYGYHDILKHCYIGCSTVIYDCEKLGKVYMPVDADKREDFACWLKILRDGEKARCFHQSLTTYRLRNNSISSNKIKLIRYQWNVYRRLEKISVIKSLYYMCHWAVLGVMKYR